MSVVSGNSSQERRHRGSGWSKYSLSSYSKRFRSSSSSGPKMYRYAAEGDWDLIPARCKSHPKEAKYIHKEDPKDTPLCRILRAEGLGILSGGTTMEETTSDESKELKLKVFGTKHAAVSALLDANPFAPTNCDTFQRTPLHWGFMDVAANHHYHHHPYSDGNNTNATTQEEKENEELNSNSSILALLLERAPEAARMIDSEQRTPLHYLVAKNDVIPIRLAATLVTIFPDALSMRDALGQTPLDILKSREEEVLLVGKKGVNNNFQEIIAAMEKLESVFPPSLSSSPSSKSRRRSSLLGSSFRRSSFFSSSSRRWSKVWQSSTSSIDQL